MRYSELRPGLVDGSVEKSKFEVVLDRNVFSKARCRLTGRLHQDILPIEAQAFVSDLRCRYFDRTERLDRIDEQLRACRQPLDCPSTLLLTALTRCIFMSKGCGISFRPYVERVALISQLVRVRPQ